MDVYTQLVQDVYIPRMVRCEQTFENPTIEQKDVPEVILQQIRQPDFDKLVQPGMTIAIPCGSRGVHNIFTILKTLVDYCKEKGAKPFIFPAMGSHGGSTAEGQLEVVNGFGITEESIGCPIKSSMEVVPIGQTEEGHTVFIDKYASEADGVILVGRVKPHTAFSGPYESGLMKMMTIGMGKQHGAEVCHKAGFKHMAHLVPLFGNVILKNAKILYGLAVLENAYGGTAYLHALHREEIPEEEPKLLLRAKELMMELYIKKVDVLIVDRIGKNYSGDGSDPHVTGAFLTPYAHGGIEAEKRVVLDLSDETHGNALGVGVFDATTKRLVERANFPLSYPNAITCTELKAAKIPMVMQSDKDCISVALKTANGMDEKHPRVIRIKNTMELTEILISEALIDEANAHPKMKVIGEPEYMQFDENGYLW